MYAGGGSGGYLKGNNILCPTIWLYKKMASGELFEFLDPLITPLMFLNYHFLFFLIFQK